MNNVYISPTTQKERILSLDVLRGFAVLGILIMNIQAFSMVSAAYMSPLNWGDMTGLNEITWYVSDIFANGKFVTIFSILFGAGVVLFSSRIEKKGMKSAGLHYRRMFWLFVIGMIHAYLIWYGDILVAYALCGMLVYLLRKKSIKTLLILSAAFLTVTLLLSFMSELSIPFWSEEAYHDNSKFWTPSAEALTQEINNYRGGWLSQMQSRVPLAFTIQTMAFAFGAFWMIMGLMLLGMALFKAGILQAERSKAFYWKSVVIGLGLGLPLVVYGVIYNFKWDWSYDRSMFLGGQFNYWGSIGMSYAYISIIMLIIKSKGWVKFKQWLSPVGKFALSNYLFTTIIATFLFYGHGFGLFCKVERFGQILITIGIWIILIIWSNLWVKKFRFGPFEWLWRSLTYWKIQPIMRNN